MIYKRYNDYNWYKALDERQQSEIEFNQLYDLSFAHGTDGHNIRVLVAKLARELARYEDGQLKHEEYIRLLEDNAPTGFLEDLSAERQRIYEQPFGEDRIVGIASSDVRDGSGEA